MAAAQAYRGPTPYADTEGRAMNAAQARDYLRKKEEGAGGATDRKAYIHGGK